MSKAALISQLAACLGQGHSGAMKHSSVVLWVMGGQRYNVSMVEWQVEGG